MLVLAPRVEVCIRELRTSGSKGDSNRLASQTWIRVEVSTMDKGAEISWVREFSVDELGIAGVAGLEGRFSYASAECLLSSSHVPRLHQPNSFAEGPEVPGGWWSVLRSVAAGGDSD